MSKPLLKHIGLQGVHYNEKFSGLRSVACDYFLFRYSPVMLHLSPATRILNEDPGFVL